MGEQGPARRRVVDAVERDQRLQAGQRGGADPGVVVQADRAHRLEVAAHHAVGALDLVEPPLVCGGGVGDPRLHGQRRAQGEQRPGALLGRGKVVDRRGQALGAVGLPGLGLGQAEGDQQAAAPLLGGRLLEGARTSSEAVSGDPCAIASAAASSSSPITQSPPPRSALSSWAAMALRGAPASRSSSATRRCRPARSASGTEP